MHEDETKLREFYEMFTKKYCISDPDAEWPGFPESFRKELDKEFPQEMEKYFYNKSGMSMTSESSFILHSLGIARQTGGARWCLEAQPFERISQESKDKMKRVFKAYSRSQNMFNTTQVSTTPPLQPTQSTYVKIYTDNNGNYISFNPKNIQSVMLCNQYTGKGECYYPNGWVNPVVNGQTVRSQGVNYDQVGRDNFMKLAQQAMILYRQQLNQQQNSVGNAYNQQQNSINFQNNNIFRSTQASMASPSKSTQSQYVKIYTDNNGNCVSFNPKNPTSIMMYNKNTGFGYCYYPDGYVNPVRNMQTMPQYGFNNGVQGQIYFYNLLQQVNRMYKASQYAKLKDQYEANNKSISKSPLIGMYNQHGLSNGFN